MKSMTTIIKLYVLAGLAVIYFGNGACSVPSPRFEIGDCIRLKVVEGDEYTNQIVGMSLNYYNTAIFTYSSGWVQAGDKSDWIEIQYDDLYDLVECPKFEIDTE